MVWIRNIGDTILSNKKISKDKLTLEIDGKKYTGYREIKGLRKPYQKVTYRNRTIDDNWTYETWKFKDPKKVMDNKARTLLRELIMQHLNGKAETG
jgi:hypothetical protein